MLAPRIGTTASISGVHDLRPLMRTISTNAGISLR
jgi:hypothetical protein